MEQKVQIPQNTIIISHKLSSLVPIRQNADRKSIVAIMDALYDLKPSPKYPKGTWHNWIDSCINEWKNGGHLFGIPSLAKEIRKNSEYAEEELAFNHIRELLEILNLGSKDNKNESGL